MRTRRPHLWRIGHTPAHAQTRRPEGQRVFKPREGRGRSGRNAGGQSASAATVGIGTPGSCFAERIASAVVTWPTLGAAVRRVVRNF